VNFWNVTLCYSVSGTRYFEGTWCSLPEEGSTAWHRKVGKHSPGRPESL